MFPYRRQGPKKRKGNPARRGRGPQRPLPNSARELIPVLQSATKALAQVLAGRSGDSGQFSYAQNVLAHADRLLADRQANRLNPADREEFLEQLARLKLTIADAEAEAEVDAEQEEAPREAAPAVDRARLREMALALSTPKPADPAPSAQPEAVQPDELESSRAATGSVADTAGGEAAQPEEAVVSNRSEHNQRSGRLQLSVSASEEAAAAVSIRGPVRRRGTTMRAPARLKPVRAEEAKDRAEGGAPTAPSSEPEEPAPGPATHQVLAETAASNGHGAAEGHSAAEAEAAPAEDGTPRRRRVARRPQKKGIPDGWVIDDEGFVVPGPS